MVNSMVVGIDEDGVELAVAGRRAPRRSARARWCGRRASRRPASPGASPRPPGAEVDRAGRITVEPDLTLPGHPEVLALGDMARVTRRRRRASRTCPASRRWRCSRGATRRAACMRRLAGREVKPFHYVDKGNLATIGRARAVAEIKRVHFGGPLAWLLWLGIHIFYLIGFQNRLLVLLRWSFSFLTRGRGARLITGEETLAGQFGFPHPTSRGPHIGRGHPARDDRSHDDHPSTQPRRSPRALPLPRRVPPVLDVALRLRRRPQHGHRPRRVDRQPAAEHRREHRDSVQTALHGTWRDLGAQQPLPRGPADRRARHADRGSTAATTSST